jgi:hypothetical protein
MMTAMARITRREGDMNSVPTSARPASCLALALAFASTAALGGALDALTSKDAGAGLKTALSQGVDRAVAQLGATDGFLKNPRVTIPLPPALEKADRALRMVGMGGDADALRETMNHAAESAVGEAGPVLRKSLRSMTLEDAKGILSGGEDSATQYFRRTSGDELRSRFKPIVVRATAKLKLASVYDQYAGKAAGLGLVSASDADLNEYVTGKALDGLFTVIADEERAIRKDPAGQASALLRKVFGSL